MDVPEGSYMLTTIFVLIFTALFFKYIQGSVHRFLKSVPGPIGLPFVGYLPFFLRAKNPLAAFQELHKRYGNVYGIKLGSANIVVISGMENIRAAVGRTDDFSDRPCSMSISMHNEEHHIAVGFSHFTPRYVAHKKIFSKALTYQYSHGNEKQFEEMVIDEVNHVSSQFQSKMGNAFNPRDIVYTAVGHIIWQICYGRGFTGREDPLFKFIMTNNREFSDFQQAGNPFDLMPILRYVMPTQFSKYIRLITEGATGRATKATEHESTFDCENIRDFTDRMILAGRSLRKEQLQTSLSADHLLHSVGDVHLAGFDTLTSALNWGLMLLADNPEVQTKVQKNIDNVLGDNLPSLSDRSKLPYVEATILEILRLGVIVPMSAPHAPTHDVTFKGYLIPKGTTVMLNAYNVCYDETLWPSPTKFDPDRFLTKSGDIDPAQTEHIMIFGIGRRKCIGEVLAKIQMFMILTFLLQRFTMVKPEGESYTLDGTYGLVNAPSPFNIRVIDRL